MKILNINNQKKYFHIRNLSLLKSLFSSPKEPTVGVKPTLGGKISTFMKYKISAKSRLIREITNQALLG